MSTYAGTDGCTDIILDFIAGGRWGDELGNPIGESDGNYNAYFGCVDSSENLCSMTLAEIYRFQDGMLAADPRSTAIGRYQFLKSTLQSLQQQEGLTNTAIFSEELQDRLGVDLLVARGYSRWWTGDLSDAEFAHQISCEWASLPDPQNDGKSHYDGDSAGNHASCSLTSVYAMLGIARDAIDPEPGPEPPALLLAAVEVIKLIQAMLLHRGLLKQPDGSPATQEWVDGLWGVQSQAALDILADQAAREK